LIAEKSKWYYPFKKIGYSFISHAISLEHQMVSLMPHLAVVKNEIHKIFIQSMRDAFSSYKLEYQAMSDRISKIASRVPLMEWTAKHTGMEIDRGVPLTMFDVLGWAMHMGTETNFDRLAAGLFQKNEKWTRELIEQTVVKFLPKEGWDVVTDLWREIDSLWPRIEAAYKDMYYYSPEKVPSRIIATPHGEIEGGYMPLMPAEGHVYKTPIDKIEDVALEGTSYLASMPRNDYSKERNKTLAVEKQARYSDRPMDPVQMEPTKSPTSYMPETNISLVSKHLGMVLRDLHYRPKLIDMHFMLKDQDFQRIWKSNFGDIGLRHLEDWVKYIANDGLKGDAIFQEVLDPLIKSATWGVMAWNVGMAVMDYTSAPLTTFNKLGFKRAFKMYTYTPAIAKALWQHAKADAPDSISRLFVTKDDLAETILKTNQEMKADPQQWNNIIDEVKSYSDWMKLRFETKYTDLYDVIYNKSKENEFQKSVFFGVFHWSQALVEIPVWKESFDRASADKHTRDDAVKIADSNVAMLFGSGRLEDRPNILQQKHGLMRALNMFSTWIYAQTGNTYVAAKSFQKGNLQQKGMAIGYMISLMMVMPAVTAMLVGQRPKDDESWLQFVAKESIGFSTRMVPMVGFFARPIAATISRTWDPMQKPMFTNAFGILEQSLNAINKNFNPAVPGDQKLESITKILPYIPMVPYVNEMNILLWNIWDSMTGEMKFDPSRDFFRRRAIKDRKEEL
jgi:hypothetical protein